MTCLLLTLESRRGVHRKEPMLATTLLIVLANGYRGSSYALGNRRSVQLSYLLHQGPLLHVLVSGLLVLIQEGLPRRV
jgi:hypothetical protein